LLNSYSTGSGHIPSGRVLSAIFCAAFFFAALMLVMPTISYASDESSSGLSVSDPYVREPVPGRAMSAAFMTLINESDAPRQLLSVSAPWAGAIEIHTHLHENGVMKMRQLSALEIPAKSSVTLQPGGLHLMLFGLEPPLDRQLPMTLCFDQGECIATEAILFSPM